MERHFILIKEKNLPKRTLNSEHLFSKIRPPSSVKETLLKFKAHIATHIVIVGDLNTPLYSMDMSGKQNKQRHSASNGSFRTIGFNRYLKNMSF